MCIQHLLVGLRRLELIIECADHIAVLLARQVLLLLLESCLNARSSMLTDHNLLFLNHHILLLLLLLLITVHPTERPIVHLPTETIVEFVDLSFLLSVDFLAFEILV